MGFKTFEIKRERWFNKKTQKHYYVYTAREGSKLLTSKRASGSGLTLEQARTNFNKNQFSFDNNILNRIVIGKSTAREGFNVVKIISKNRFTTKKQTQKVVEMSFVNGEGRRVIVRGYSNKGGTYEDAKANAFKFAKANGVIADYEEATKVRVFKKYNVGYRFEKSKSSA